jgi:hypothetical protein
MAKNRPIINHTKIIVYAIHHIESELESMKKRCEGVPGAESILQAFVDQYTPELEGLKEMYRIETGVEYV